MVMRTLNAARRFILLLLLIPVVFIFLNAVLRGLGAQQRNPIVSGVRRVADFFIIAPFETVFEKQSYVQTAEVSLICYAVLALLVMALFKALQSAASARPPRSSAAPLPRPRAQSTPAPAASAASAPTASAAGTTDKTTADTPPATNKTDETTAP